ncbi:hypothetical protein LV779_21585 [Streptomyces thinghirensis]|nr:hypothetical protein [Streptomyces thinghirensis]
MRRGRTLALTVAGRTFLGSVERALAEVERAADEVRADADPATGKVAFGFLHTMGAETVPGLPHAFRADHPRVRFSPVQNYGEAMLEAPARGRAGPLPDLPGPRSPPTSSPAASMSRSCAWRSRPTTPAGR